MLIKNVPSSLRYMHTRIMTLKCKNHIQKYMYFLPSELKLFQELFKVVKITYFHAGLVFDNDFQNPILKIVIYLL